MVRLYCIIAADTSWCAADGLWLYKDVATST